MNPAKKPRDRRLAEIPPPAVAAVAARRSPPTAWRSYWPVVLCGLLYLLIAGGFRGHYEQTDHAHHLYIADAFLHGQFHLRQEALDQMEALATQRVDAELARQASESGKVPTPEERQTAIKMRLYYVTLLDWSIVNGKVYGYWAPLTPIVMMPFVAAFGAGISDNLLSALFGALNLTLFYRLLRCVDATGLLPLTEPCRKALTLGLGLGTVHFYMCCHGTSWFTAQIVTLAAFLAACLAIVSAGNRRREVLLSGAFFGAALLGRNVVVALAPFFVIMIFARTSGLPDRRRELLRRYALFGLPWVIALALQGAYNYARFSDLFETGQAALIRQTGHPRFVEEFDRYGQFHPHFLARNARYYLWNWSRPPDAAGRRSFDPDGNSMFLVTPLLLYALLAWRRRTAFTLALACGALTFLLALLLFRATGFDQFGNRYLLESLPLWLLLAATGMRGRLTRTACVLLALSIAVNLFGTYRFCEPLFGLPKSWL